MLHICFLTNEKYRVSVAHRICYEVCWHIWYLTALCVVILAVFLILKPIAKYVDLFQCFFLEFCVVHNGQQPNMFHDLVLARSTGSPTTARNEQVCAHQNSKSHRGVKFSEMSLELLCTWWTVVVHPYWSFLCGVRWRHSRPTNSEPHVFVNFVEVWGRIVSPLTNQFERNWKY